jgi:hypothetical protein
MIGRRSGSAREAARHLNTGWAFARIVPLTRTSDSGRQTSTSDVCRPELSAIGSAAGAGVNLCLFVRVQIECGVDGLYSLLQQLHVSDD